MNVTLKYFEGIKNDDNSEKIANVYSSMVNDNPEYFEPYNHDGTKPVLKKGKMMQGKKLYDELKDTPHLAKAATMYEPYLYYSQYDHFGSMFYMLSRLPNDAKLKMMSKAVNAFPRNLVFLNILLKSIYPAETFLADTLKETEEFIDSMK